MTYVCNKCQDVGTITVATTVLFRSNRVICPDCRGQVIDENIDKNLRRRLARKERKKGQS